MSIRNIIDWAIQESRGEIRGLIASEIAFTYDVDGNAVYVADVDIGETEVLKSVPIAFNNRDISFAEIGKPVMLTRMVNSKYAITGLAKTKISTAHYIYVEFDEDLWTITDETLTGFSVRLLEFGELDTYGGFGVVPFGAYAKFTADGTFVRLI